MSGKGTNFRPWVKKADHDLLAIRNNVSAKETPWDVVCFHAQQLVEKLLKAFLVYHGRAPERTHDLVPLLTACVKLDASLNILEEDCQRLTYYAVSSRYPSDLREPDEVDGRKAIAAAERIRRAILSRLLPKGL